MKILLAVLVTISFVSCSHEPKNPRTMNGKTYLRTKDSVYFITFQIDSVISMEYEPQDKNE
jgi:hypothetical protein